MGANALTKDRKRPLGIRSSVLVWIGSAVIGWAVATVAIYSVVRFSDKEMVAEDERAPGGTKLARPEADKVLTPEELRKLRETAPAAGSSKPD